MATLRTLIQSCDKCDLCKNNIVSPVATEYLSEGRPDILIVIGSKVQEENDTYQEVLRGPLKQIIKDIGKKIKRNIALTFLIKCATTKAYYSLKNTKDCDWLLQEIDLIKPKIIIGMGSKNLMEKQKIKFDIITDSPLTVLGSKISTDKFVAHLESLINDK